MCEGTGAEIYEEKLIQSEPRVGDTALIQLVLSMPFAFLVLFFSLTVLLNNNKRQTLLFFII